MGLLITLCRNNRNSVEVKKCTLLIFIALIAFALPQKCLAINAPGDTSQVIKLNKQGFAMRLTNPDQTVKDATNALAIAKKINYMPGTAEAYRVMGVGSYYLDQAAKAIDYYLTALNYFKQIKDIRGEGKVYNNIGNLYRNSDYDLSLEFFTKALPIAQKLSDKQLTASIYFNIGAVYYHKNSFNQALNYYDKANVLFVDLKDSVNLIQCLQNKGVMYFNLNQFNKAEAMLSEANKEAKQADLNEPVGSINLTLAELYIAENKFNEAEKSITEGETYSAMVKGKKLLSDFKYTSYQLELKRKKYESALKYLQDIYKHDSTTFKQGVSTQITIMREQVKQQQSQRENELLRQRQAYDRVKFWAVVIVAGLLLVLVGLLINNVKSKAKTNTQLTNLNAEVLRQKDDLNKINHHLEEIINERTQDLQEKNKKLSAYSSYLSHQIRGPIATLKGLINLEKEGLVDGPECIRMMNKCVGEIDDKIIEMSDILHD